MEYRVSVIIGIYNCATTLRAALDSMLVQTYKHFKVIMCDDGSSDDTYSVAKEYADKYENFILIKNAYNMKLAATLNHCIEYVDTEYIARMDGDDISAPTRLEKLVSFLDAHPEYAFVSSAMIHFDDTGDWKVTRKEPEPTINSFKWTSPFCHAPVLMRAEALRAVGCYTDEPKVERMEDYYLWHKFYCLGYKGYNLQEPLYRMRDDKYTIVRRRGLSRNFQGYKTDIEVLKNLKIKAYWLIPTIKFLRKLLIPNFMMNPLRKLKAKIQK